jgi:hypothetical protein
VGALGAVDATGAPSAAGFEGDAAGVWATN